MNDMSEPLVHKWKCNDSTATVTVSSWYDFVELIDRDFIDHSEYIFRGQKDSRWTLRSKFDREYRNSKQLLAETDPLKGLSPQDQSLVKQSGAKLLLDARSVLLERLLMRFKKACTGRRGLSPKLLSDTEWWALGQHFGLSTPLLDWTKSPYVAVYFAFADSAHSEECSRAIWVYSHDGLMEIFTNPRDGVANESGAIKVIEGLIDENARIVSQTGLFTETPAGEDIEEYIENEIELVGMGPILFKINIPGSLRETFLRHLDTMNINHNSLFPDISGAAEYANRSLERECADLLWRARPSSIKRLLSNDAYHGDESD